MDTASPQGPSELPGADELIPPVPRVTIQAFCETHDVASVVQDAFGDRRLLKAQAKLQMGGPAAALEAFRSAPTPNIIMIEAICEPGPLISYLDQIAEVCDEGTRLIVLGHRNDVQLYRDLVRRGVSDYLIAPLDVLTIVRALSGLYSAPGTASVGRTIAVVGAKGGVGSSTIAHNIAWAISRNFGSQTVIVDLDIAFGTAGLNFNQDPPQGIAEAIFSPERVDANFVDRLLSRCSDKLSLLAAPALLDRTTDFDGMAIDPIIDLLRQTVPTIVLDVPHVWQDWTRRMLLSSDEVVIVAQPDLASLRNAKNLADLCRTSRPNDRLPKLVLNQVGVPKRPEIGAGEFPKALKLDLAATIPFDPQLFGTAANNGQMIAEIQASGKVTDIFSELASMVTGKLDVRRARRNFLEPIMTKLIKRKAS